MMTQTKPAATNQTNQTPQTRGNGLANPTPGAQPVQPAANVAPILEMHEAPYSWNVSAQDANGFVEMFTVRAVSFEGFTSRVEMMKARLLERGYKPAPTRGASASAAQTRDAETQPDAPMCAIHKTPMQERTGRNGQKFWSCPQRLDTGEFCPYRPPKQ